MVCLCLPAATLELHYGATGFSSYYSVLGVDIAPGVEPRHPLAVEDPEAVPARRVPHQHGVPLVSQIAVVARPLSLLHNRQHSNAQ